MAKQIGTLGNVQTISRNGSGAGFNFVPVSPNSRDTAGDFIHLQAVRNTSNAGQTGASFRVFGGTSGFQVPTGRTLRVRVIKLTTPVGVTADSFTLLYTDNDGGLTTSTFTNAVYAAGDGTYFPFNYTGSVINNIEWAVDFAVPTGKYLTIRKGAAANDLLYVEAIGYLE